MAKTALSPISNTAWGPAPLMLIFFAKPERHPKSFALLEITFSDICRRGYGGNRGILEDGLIGYNRILVLDGDGRPSLAEVGGYKSCRPPTVGIGTTFHHTGETCLPPGEGHCDIAPVMTAVSAHGVGILIGGGEILGHP